MSSKVAAFRSVFEEALTDIAQETGPPSNRCLILSGGVDTCAILAAATKLGIHFDAAVTVVTEEKSPDFGYATAAAKEHGSLKHYVVRLTAEELVTTYLPVCIKLLGIFDGMTLRNSLVVAAAFQKVSEISDAKHVIVGDGADELFGGYSFMWKSANEPAVWKDKRDKMCAKWTFATETLANHFGLTPHSPYMEPMTVDWAIENTGSPDCIGVRPIQLFYGEESQEHQTGKLILREAYKTVASWRRKDPIEVGSGATIIGKNDFWKDLVSDEEFEAERAALLTRGFVIKDKEQLFNFRAFEKQFGVNGTNLSTRKRLSIGKGCVGCCFDIGEETFCRMCGAWPAQRSNDTS